MPIWMANSKLSLYEKLEIAYESGYINDSGVDLRALVSGYAYGMVIPPESKRIEITDFGKRTREEVEVHFSLEEVTKIENSGVYIKEGSSYITWNNKKYMVTHIQNYATYFPFGVMKVIMQRGIDIVN